MKESVSNNTMLDIDINKQETSTNDTDKSIQTIKTSNDIIKKTKTNIFSYTIVDKAQSKGLSQKKKPKLFETIAQPLIPEKTIPSTASVPIPQIEKQIPQKGNKPKFRDNYLDLLIISANKLLISNEITMDYLNTPTVNPKQLEVLNSTREDELQAYSKKCENPICAVVVENYLQMTKAKFNNGKLKSVFLCEQCYSAWVKGQYCFYCNIIYRDFSFNQQYYEKSKWIQCDYCQKWEHIQCEESKGIYTHIEELNNDMNFKYKCPLCRGYNKKSNKQSTGNDEISENNVLLRKKRNKSANDDDGYNE